MVKVGALIVPPELEGKYRKVVNANDRYWHSRAIKKCALLSRPRLRAITLRSLLPQIAAEWNAMPQADKDAWAIAGIQQGMTGYNSYVNDKSWRIKSGMSGNVVASTKKQGKVGKIVIHAPDNEVELLQAHPIAYWIVRKKSGTKSQYEKVMLTEILTLPLEIGISYKSSLVPNGAESYAQFYAIVLSEYQGTTIETQVSIDFVNDSVWRRQENSISAVRGEIRGYSLGIHIFDMAGTLRFDNVKAEHSGQNWARDKRCNSVATNFTRQYYNVPKHWVPEILEANSDLYSEYHTLYYTGHLGIVGLGELQLGQGI